jgi:hypothetical protein
VGVIPALSAVSIFRPLATHGLTNMHLHTGPKSMREHHPLTSTHSIPSWGVCAQDQVAKLRDEREAAGREVAVLRADLEGVRGERERLVAEVAAMRSELDRCAALGLGLGLATLGHVMEAGGLCAAVVGEVGSLEFS